MIVLVNFSREKYYNIIMNVTPTKETNDNKTPDNEQAKSDQIFFDKSFEDRFYETTVKYYLLSGRKFH